MNIEYTETEQCFANETTTAWFLVDDEKWGIRFGGYPLSADLVDYEGNSEYLYIPFKHSAQDIFDHLLPTAQDETGIVIIDNP